MNQEMQWVVVAQDIGKETQLICFPRKSLYRKQKIINKQNLSHKADFLKLS